MTGQALDAGGAGRKRAFFGLFEADGWSWASVKAVFWFVVIVLLLGYLPDRAYYFTVFPTIDLGVNVVSPINFCPPSNRTLPCPVPPGAVVPWDPAPAELDLPQARTDGSIVQSGTKLIYIGGSDGTAASGTTFVASLFGGTFGPWKAGPDLPAPRAGAATIFLSGSIYVIGGRDASGKPTDTVFVSTHDAATGELGAFKASDALKLPEARAGAAVVSTASGLELIGGDNGTGPQPTVWHSAADTKGALGAWAADAALPTGIADASAGLVGDYVFLYGGRDPNGPVGLVLRGSVGGSKDAAANGRLVSWAIGGHENLPVARTRAAGFVANGTLYLPGGTDGTAPRGELYWAVPDANGNIAEWSHLPATDLPASGLAGGAAVTSGSQAFVIGGTAADGATRTSVRANLAPQPPFFQLGLLGATIPALKIDGEIGQQLGYLNASAVGGLDFALLLLVGWAFAHPARTREILGRVRRRRRR